MMGSRMRRNLMNKLPLAPNGSVTDTEPKTLEVKNLNIQGVYGLEPGDPDPEFRSRMDHDPEPPSRAFDALDDHKSH
jgi:hypothetical protein